MAADIQGYLIRNKNKLSHWSALLEEWLFLINDYACCLKEDDKTHTDDTPYFHSERENIGILYDAAWRAGWISVEEFHVRTLLTEIGRFDLWFHPLDKEEEDEDEYIEVKIASKFEKIIEKLEEAKDDIRKLHFADQDKHLLVGIVLFCPGIKSIPELNIAGKINEIIRLQKFIDWDVLAWSFPKEARELKIGSDHYPGIMLFGKIAN